MNKVAFCILGLSIFFSCEDESQVVDCSNSDLSLEILGTNDAICGTSTGTIEVSATGGVPPYTFSLGGSSANSDGLFAGLSQGVYQVTATDANDCSVFKEATVVQSGEVSFSQLIAPILENNCTLPTCHVPEPGTSRQNLTDFNIVQQLASEIKRRTQNGEMPKTGSITQTQIDLIACWVDNGALDN